MLFNGLPNPNHVNFQLLSIKLFHFLIDDLNYLILQIDIVNFRQLEFFNFNFILNHEVIPIVPRLDLGFIKNYIMVFNNR